MAGQIGRRALLRGAAAAGAAALSGCAGNDNSLTFFFQAQPDEAKVRLRIIDEFRKHRPDITIRTELAGPDPQQQILTYCSGGRCPDVLMAWELTYSELVELGVLLDLNTMLAADRDFATRLQADCPRPVYDTFGFHGGQYALPEQWAGIFLFYNKTHFAQAGLRPPPTRWEDPWSFEEFLDAAKALTRRDRSGEVTRWGFVDPWVQYYSASIFGMNNGIDWFSPPINATRTNMDDPLFAEGFQFYADLATRHRVAPRAANMQSASASDTFAQGKAAMTLSGHWMYPAFVTQPDLDFDVTVLPTGPHADRARSDVGTTGLAIAADSPRKEQAWEFVKFATGPVGQAVIAESGLFVPALTSALRSPGFAAAHPRVRNLEVFTGGPENSRPLPVTPVWHRVEAALHRGSDRVLRGAASADWFGHGPAAEINRLLGGAT